jgi:hypothetical protein
MGKPSNVAVNSREPLEEETGCEKLLLLGGNVVIFVSK